MIKMFVNTRKTQFNREPERIVVQAGCNSWSAAHMCRLKQDSAFVDASPSCSYVCGLGD